jgi:hypothetical protein
MWVGTPFHIVPTRTRTFWAERSLLIARSYQCYCADVLVEEFVRTIGSLNSSPLLYCKLSKRFKLENRRILFGGMTASTKFAVGKIVE